MHDARHTHALRHTKAAHHMTGAQREGERLKALLGDILLMPLGPEPISGTGPLVIDGISYQLGTSPEGVDTLIAGAECPVCGNRRFLAVRSQAALGIFIANVQSGERCPSCAYAGSRG